MAKEAEEPKGPPNLGVLALGVRNLSHVKTKLGINSRMKNTTNNKIPRVVIHTSTKGGSPVGYGGGSSALKPNFLNLRQGEKKKKKVRKLKIATWNIQGWNTKDTEVIEEFKNSNIDILVMSETKKKGNGSEKINDIVHLWSGVNKSQRAKAGVGILFKKKYERAIKNWEPVNERLIKVNLNIYGREIVIMGVYGPTDDSAVIEKETFMEMFREEIEKSKQMQELIIAGDLNGRVGRRENDNTIGRFGEEDTNDNGDRLTALCELTELKVTNGFFKHKNIHKYTWEQVTRNLRSIIDYVIVRKRHNFKIKDVRVKRGIECGSDHKLLLSEFEFPWFTFKTDLKQNNRTEKENTEKIKNKSYKLHLLQDESIQDLYKNRLDRQLNEFHYGTLTEIYDHIKECIDQAALEALGEEGKTHKYKTDLTETTKLAIKYKKELYNRWLSTKHSSDLITYREQNREVKRMVSKEKNEQWKRACMYVEQYIGGTRNSESWKIIRSLKANKKEKANIHFVENKNWLKYYTELLTEKRKDFLTQSTNENTTNTHVENIQISEDDVRQALKTSKNKKAPGPGNIYIELLKYGTEKLHRMLQNIFQRALNGEQVPIEWKEAYLSSIFKKGDRRNCENYRGISVLSAIGRLYGKIVKYKIEETIKGKIGNDQAGFTVGKSCIDHIYTIQQLLERKRAKNKDVHLAFIDLKKAYDLVPRSKLWLAMEEINVPQKLINAVKELYNNNKIHVRVAQNIIGSIVTTKGLLQGCSTSPTLFKIYLEATLRNWKKKCEGMGIQVRDDYLYTLSFADDQVVIAQDDDDLSFMIRKLHEEYRKAGMEINFKKTEYLAMKDTETEDLVIEDDLIIRACKEFKYLGFLVSDTATTEKEINSRLGQTRACIKQLHPILWNDHITKNTKTMIYNSLVRSIFTYGAENWVIHKKNQRKINAVEMEYWRRCCQLTRLDRVRNDDIRARMNVETDTLTYIEEKRLLWYGHVKRSDVNGWVHKVTDWSPIGKRKRGRPRRSFRDEVDDAMRKRDLEEGQWEDRDEWRKSLREGRQRQL